MRTLATALIASFAAACGAPIEPAPEVGAGSTQVIASSVSPAQPEGPAPPGLVLRSFVEVVPADPLAAARATRGQELGSLHEDVARCRVASGALKVDAPSVSFHVLDIAPSGAVTAGSGSFGVSEPEAAACVERALSKLALPPQPTASVLGLAVTLLPQGMKAQELPSALPPKAPKATPAPPVPAPAKPATPTKPPPSSKSPPKVRQTQTMVGPKFPPELIQRVVRQKFTKIRFCYEWSLQTDPSLAGRVVVKFTVDTKGAAKDVKATSDELKSPQLLSCIEQAFAALTFPAPDGGQLQVTYPFVLDNAGADASSLLAGPTLAGQPLHALEDAELALELGRFGEVRAVEGGRAYFAVGRDGVVRAFLRLPDPGPLTSGGRCVARSAGEAIAVLTKDDADCAATLAVLLD